MYDEWTKLFPDERLVKFTCQELANDGAFITAQIAGNVVVYSIVLTELQNLPNREEVEMHFADELAKK